MAFPRIAALLLLALSLRAQALEYRLSLRFRGESSRVSTRFRLLPTPPLVTRNRVQKPRMGGWRLEAEQPKDATFSQARVLAGIERLLYLSGPAPGVRPANFHVRLDGHNCRIWSVEIPAGVQAHAFLAELYPGLLALSYFSGVFPEGDLEAAELQLERVGISPHTAPAEEGQALLATLRRLAGSQRQASAGAEEALERIL